jgi:hypothetical protein
MAEDLELKIRTRRILRDTHLTFQEEYFGFDPRSGLTVARSICSSGRVTAPSFADAGLKEASIEKAVQSPLTELSTQS